MKPDAPRPARSAADRPVPRRARVVVSPHHYPDGALRAALDASAAAARSQPSW
jgi:hypothetical protein